MAIGLSGSNGGITKSFKEFNVMDYDSTILPMEVSYFVNNVCNLNCRHCYVGYLNQDTPMDLKTWITVFNSLLIKGAKTFGNVGKEPLLNWELTKNLLQYFHYRRKDDNKIRYGLVTNALLFDNQIINELSEIKPNYIDISIDGTEQSHEFIRGRGTYQKLISNLNLLSEANLSEIVYLSFTLNRINKDSLTSLVNSMDNLGFKNLLISPYVTLNQKDDLFLLESEMISLINLLLDGKLIDFRKFNYMNFYIKSDYTTSKNLMIQLRDQGIINEEALLIDDYGVIFNKYTLGNNNIYFNYIPFDNTYKQAIRISHDGYVSSCLDMFYENYTDRAIGNINEQDILQILSKSIQNNLTLETSPLRGNFL